MPIATTPTRFLYKHFAKPFFFANDPEGVHDRIVNFGEFLGQFWLTRQVTSLAWRYKNQTLSVTKAGITFPNPIGLGAGFDKQGQLTNILPSVGFGFVEIGSVTGLPCPGNPKPRLWRAPNHKSLVVHIGLKSDGAEAVSARLRRRPKTSVPLGVNIAAANLAELDTIPKQIGDYVFAQQELLPFADYVTINISCPNTLGGEPFAKPENLAKLLSALNLKKYPLKPHFLKVSSESTDQEIKDIVAVAIEHGVAGFVSANLRKQRPADWPDTAPQKGGLSGKPVFERSNHIIKLIRSLAPETVIIGLGGVFTVEDVKEKIRCGADLVQLVSGMIFEGPQVIGDLNKQLFQSLKSPENQPETVEAELEEA